MAQLLSKVQVSKERRAHREGEEGGEGKEEKKKETRGEVSQSLLCVGKIAVAGAVAV